LPSIDLNWTTGSKIISLAMGVPVNRKGNDNGT